MLQPPPPPMTDTLGFFSLRTMALMIAITFLIHASAVVFNSRMVKEYKGIRAAAFAAGALALQYLVVFALPPGKYQGTFSNALVITGYALMYLAICRFVDKPVNRIIMYWIVPLGYLGLIVLATLPPGTFILPITISRFVSVPLTFASAYTLYRTDTTRFTMGAYLTAIPFALYGLVATLRVVQGFTARELVVPGATWSNVLDGMSTYVLSYLWVAGFILMISQRLQSDLHDLAMNDALTRVRNRRAMQDMLDFEMQRVQTDVKDFSVILLDVDHFKQVNDTHGHDVGDLVLQWLAQTMQSTLRVQDIVSRWGGEEFLVLLPDTSLEEAMEIAERLRMTIESTPVADTPVPIKITFSGGVANSQTNRDVDLLCKVADKALYIAKETRNRIVSEHEIKE